MDATKKAKVVEAIEAQIGQYPSAAKMAKALDINSSQLSRIRKGDTDRVLSDGKWVGLARRLNVELKNRPAWQTAQTEVFKHIYKQLEVCQSQSLSAALCDIPDIGKTHTAKEYARRNKGAVYVDCSQVKTKQQFVRAIAREFGLDRDGRYKDVYDDLVYYIKSSDSPLVILDELGDLHYPAFLELKALWNATERACGWYLMGADGLKQKMESNRARNKVGYAELHSRFGSRYQRITPMGGESLREYKSVLAVQVAIANNSQIPHQEMLALTNGSLRRVYTEINKPK